ncbi:Hint domain-containing protein [Asaia astilbis]|uniref:Hint domain-containing protein n=1 Tax=Asaia astilbis TaxID=610244 RepID=UPI00047286A6|nr:Hint domain-containing protein [Asaia astilbis]
MTLTGTTSPTSIISGFNGNNPGSSDQIILRDIPKSDILGVSYPGPDLVEFTLKGNRKLTLNVPGVQKFGFDLADGAGNSTIFSVCFLEGTLIRTPRGEQAIETLNVGDSVFVYHRGQEEIQRVGWIGHRQIDEEMTSTFGPTQYPVRIKAHAFAENVPYKDLLVTPEHCLFIDGALVPARMIVNNKTIYHDQKLKTYQYFHIETNTHSVVSADGMLCESYLDTGNRDGLTTRNADAPLTSVNETDVAERKMAARLEVLRSFVEPIWRRLAQRAGIEPTSKTHHNPEPVVHLCTEAGERILPTRISDARYVFTVPGDAEIVYLCSQSAKPSEQIGPFVDDRRELGVLVGDVNLFSPQGSTAIDVRYFLKHARGWHAVKPEQRRWTNGRGVLPIGASSGSRVLSVQILAAGSHP